MKKEIYSRAKQISFILGKLEDYVTRTDQVELVRQDRLYDSHSNGKGDYLIAHFTDQGVTLAYAASFNHDESRSSYVTITLFGKPKGVGEVEKIVLAEIKRK
jgi:uncharacterized protein YxeA